MSRCTVSCLLVVWWLCSLWLFILGLYVGCGTEVSHVMNSDSNETIATTHHSTNSVAHLNITEQIFVPILDVENHHCFDIRSKRSTSGHLPRASSLCGNNLWCNAKLRVCYRRDMPANPEPIKCMKVHEMLIPTPGGFEIAERHGDPRLARISTFFAPVVLPVWWSIFVIVWNAVDLFTQGLFTTPRDKVSFAGLRSPGCSLL